ncbi:putative glutathione s-transferase-related transmembrane [hydrocarbon metagenome]|uniref:Putative glutathione s-transferase-related transmembrane n=1 Tax=hydrocarbon metagenome TaxID=938273 RepID=A0A0W8FJU4_9ZZZZ|nr:SRPBCC domain-containing protein [Methanomicrobiaceae archaeon]
MMRTEQVSGEMVITRTFGAPREFVWRAWTEAEYINRWWGPKDFTAPVIRIDLREGGRYLYCMRSPEGQDFWSTGVFREIVPMERIVATDSFSDAKGNVVSASTYGMSGDWPDELVATVTFADADGRTEVTIREAGIPEGEMRDQAVGGWMESLDKLAEVLKEGEIATGKTHIAAEPGRQEIVISRIFDAPREAVFDTYLDPALVPRWWGPKRFTTTVDAMEVRRGGIWRYVQRDPDGNVFAFFGVYHDIVPPERVIYTFEFEGTPGHVQLETVTLEDLNGRTKVTDQAVFRTVEERDGMLSTGMEEGVNESMDRFAALVERKRSP